MRYNTSIDSRERGDCTVRAFAYALGITYAKAYKIMAKAGRPKNGSPTWLPFLRNTVPDVDLRIIHHYTVNGRPTLHQFVKKYRQGTYLVGVQSHMLTVRNGIVCDSNKSGPRTRVFFAWEPQLRQDNEEAKETYKTIQH
jgi:hypothetical protein